MPFEFKSAVEITSEGEIVDRFRDRESHATEIEDSSDGVLVRKHHTPVRLAFDALGDDQVKALTSAAGIDWDPAYTDRVVKYVASDERVDRDGDIIRQKWDFSNFDLNPVVCWAHSWYSPPIGNTIERSVEQISVAGYSGPALVLTNLFATAEQSPNADTILRLIKAGFLRASSVGFRPTKVLYIEDEEERNTLGLGRWGVVVEEAELLEHSPCTIPANPGALVQVRSAKASGLIHADDIDVLREISRESVVRVGGDAKAWKRIDANWRAAWADLFPDEKVEAHADPDLPIIPNRKKEPQGEKNHFAELTAAVSELSGAVRAMADDIKTDLEGLAESIEIMKSEQNADSSIVKPSGGNKDHQAMLSLTERISAASKRVKALTTSETNHAGQA